MCDEWMPVVQFPLSIEQFHRLPRNSAYKYEFLGGQACLSPRPKHYHAILDLRPIQTDHPAVIQPLQDSDFARLVPLFGAAFRSTQPYGSLDDATRSEASRQALERTRTGGDGPWIQKASFMARDKDKPVGAILVTLLPDGDPCDWDTYHWPKPPPADCITGRLGRPHLTWIFVTPLEVGHGLGTALLAAAVRELLALGFTQLLSTFMIGNDSSMLWHWRNGFQLLAYPGSVRLMQERWKQKL